jgi:hypothetical protein
VEQALDNWGTIHKDPINDTSRNILLDNLKYDYELYNFAKARMFKQLENVHRYRDIKMWKCCNFNSYIDHETVYVIYVTRFISL